MELQKIAFPKSNICDLMEMYFRNTSRVFYNECLECLIIEERESIKTNTYFNSFSIDKWKKYTCLNDLFLRIVYQGNISVTIIENTVFRNQVIEKPIFETVMDSPEKTEAIIDIPIDSIEGQVSFKITSLDGEATVYGGSYDCHQANMDINEINIAINICTFMREKYVYRNMDILEKTLFSGSYPDIASNVRVFITDNGSSLDENLVNHEWIHLTKQGDNGSAGGFTRGLIEIIKDNEVRTKKYTNVIMMDDDVIIDPNSIVKTYRFLQLLKPEFMDAFVGGALLRTDYQNVQYISGGTWDIDRCYIMHKIGYDLKELANVIKNEIEDNAEVNGWWYCCIPMSVVRRDNLPWPSYFHMDDMEYDIRNCKHLILLNGISVWHEPFEFKYSSYTKYYDTRNVAITHMVHYDKYNRKDLKKFIWSSVRAQVFDYRYKDAEIVLVALNDLLKGPNWLKSINPIEHLDHLIEMGYKKHSADELGVKIDYTEYLTNQFYREGRKKHLLRIITLNGHLLPASKKTSTIVQMFGPHPGTVYRNYKIINYDELTGKVFVTEKNLAKCLSVFWRTWIVKTKLMIHFNSLKNNYRNEFPDMCTMEFWENYLR